MKIHLIDGTFELFRHYHALPRAQDAAGREVGAVRGVLASLLSMLRSGTTHIAVATDHVIESFRNQLWPGYKTGEGVPADLLAQFPLLEEVLATAGFLVWPMIEFEADDALAAGAALAARDPRVEQVVICTPDKDLAQCVQGTRVVQLNRITGALRDESGVRDKFGVTPASIPDYLALVGDTADGYPGIPGWGAKSSATVLDRYKHIDMIPAQSSAWDVRVANAVTLANTLQEQIDRALLFRTLATLKTDLPLFADVEELRWNGPSARFDELAALLDAAKTQPPAEGERVSKRRFIRQPSLRSAHKPPVGDP